MDFIEFVGWFIFVGGFLVVTSFLLEVVFSWGGL